LKRRLGVAAYPTTDLTKDLPGIPPTDDFSKVKAQNQVTHETFIKAIEPYFRPFSEDDLTFLRQQVCLFIHDHSAYIKGDNIAPYIIPPLGPDYLEVWQADADLPFHGSPAPGPHPDMDNCVPRGSAEGLRDDQLDNMDLVSAGPLAERVLSALVEEKVTSEEKDASEKDADAVNSMDAAGGGGQSWRVAVSKADYASFEERLKGELKYIGLLTMSEDGLANGTDDGAINWNNREDDEICQELRKLQIQLRQQSLENAARKMILEKKVEEQLAYQEYATILDDLDKQVGDAFNKRTKSIKAKKKRSIGGAGGGSSAGAGGSVAGKTTEKPGIGDGAKAIIERRRRWVEKVGPVFRPIEKFIRVPTTQEGGSIYADLDEYIKKAEEEAKMEELRMVEERN
jgi:transcriptional adapter 3